MSEDLAQAYRRAIYRVQAGSGNLDLRVDRSHPDLAALLAARQATTAALLTACNPGSRLARPNRNASANALLVRRVRDAGLDFIPTEALDPDGRWPVEPGLLILGIECSRALDLATAFGQNAYLWIDTDGTPTLMWTGLEGS